ncbi:sigma-54-dependent Fis family transcriptional regulator [Candidatus Fermentibacteria bacterium]|nr:sigma-54-dependent Fis family transcriptional regulator [Candidatus Fermentibacteria bacterium]
MARQNGNGPHVLIVDDVPANLKILRDVLEPEGFSILGASDGPAALRIARGALPDLVLLDVVMPGMDGYEVCRALKADETTRQIPVIFVTVQEDKESLIRGFEAGGVDYVGKPFEKEEILLRVRTHLQIARLSRALTERNQELEERAADLAHANRQLQEANDQLREEMAKRRDAEEAVQLADDRLALLARQEGERWGIEGFIGRSTTVKRILDDVRAVQTAEKTAVLITGESGTGKELVARAIHFGGPRSGGPFVTVNCSAVPKELAESIFFGHARGAFTGAHASHRGYFELAHGGTLFLDEIGDMDVALQAKLLRALESACITPVGSTREQTIDVRVVAATNQDLRARMAQGLFRNDLYYRLARFTVKVPPLRDRREDIPLLVDHFLTLFAADMGLATPTMDPEALQLLERYPFPGNVRELKNIIEYAVLRGRGTEIGTEHLGPAMGRAAAVATVSASEGTSENDRVWQLVIQRARGHSDTTGPQRETSLDGVVADEERVLAYLRTHGSVDNAECRDLLGVDLHRASYLLKKLHRYGVLEREGSARWTRYRLVTQR